MEHRISARRPARLNIHVRDAERDLGWFRTRDLGPGGIGIQGRLPGLKTNTYLRTTLQIEEGGEAKLINLPALLVYQGPDSAGLMWASEASELRRLGNHIAALAA